MLLFIGLSALTTKSQRGDQTILFVSNRVYEQSSEIFIMNDDGSSQTRLTHNDPSYLLVSHDLSTLLRTLMNGKWIYAPGYRTDDYPAWSFDGQQIAYLSGEFSNALPKVHKMKYTGTGKKLADFSLMGASFPPSWSPDGAKILFSAYAHGSPQIHVVDSNGSYPIQLTQGADKGIYHWSPRWSPDGEKIAYIAVIGVFVMDKNGLNNTRVNDLPIGPVNLAWAPDGSILAVAGEKGIFIIDIAEMKTEQVIDWEHVYCLSFSPDGSTIAFTAPIRSYTNYELFLFRQSSSETVRLTYGHNISYKGCPDWNPNGEQILFASDKEGNLEIYSIKADGTNETRLTYNDTDDWFPRWRPVLSEN